MTDLVATKLHLADRIDGVDFRLAPGELVAIVGPNGSGKSSLIRLLAGQLIPDAGSLSFGGAAMRDFNPLERARRLAYLPQRAEVAWPIRVSDMVALGRFAFGEAGPASAPGEVMRWLGEVGCAHLADRSTATLSGGEVALVALARIFAAETPLLLLDEPVAALDPRRQIDIMTRLATRSRAGQGIAVVLHDLNLAAQFADRIVWMKDARVVTESPPGADAVSQHAAAVFDISIGMTEGADGRADGLYIRRSDGTT